MTKIRGAWVAWLVWIALAAVLFTVGMCSRDAVAQPPAPGCKPFYVCPYEAGGSGGGGVGGASGGGSVGGVGGGNPVGGLVVDELTLSRRVIATGQSLEAEVRFRNTSSAPITLREVLIAARAPGASHADGPYTDLAPTLSMVTIPANGYATLAASRAFGSGDTLGRWEAYATYQDADGWHDAPSEYFRVIAASGGSGGSGGGDKPAAMTIGTQEWFIAPWAGTEIYKPGVNWSTAYASGADIWNPTFIGELSALAKVFRHMDTNATNFSKISRWSQRKAVTDPGNQEIYIDGGSDSDTTGMAIEWQIDLCNRAGVDCWFTHPFLADDDYLTEQAKLIKAKLDPSRRVYVELSNEVWNGSFSAFDQSIAAGEEIGIGGSNQYYVGINFEMHRALAMYEIYQSVFGASAMGSRVVRVFSESGNLDLTTQALRDVYESAEWNPHGQRIDMLAMAPYVGNGQNGATEELERWNREVDDRVEGDIAYALDHHVRAYDLPLFGCYEAGMHHLQNANVWAAHDDVYDGYVYMLDRFAEVMTGPCCLYTLHGKWDSGGAWGLYDHVGQSISAAGKARAAKEWSAGVAVRATGTKRVIIVVAIVLILVLALLVWLQLRRVR